MVQLTPHGCHHPSAGHQPSKDQIATPSTDAPPMESATPSLLAIVFGDGWRQRSTLAFRAKSLVSKGFPPPTQRELQTEGKN